MRGFEGGARGRRRGTKAGDEGRKRGGKRDRRGIRAQTRLRGMKRAGEEGAGMRVPRRMQGTRGVTGRVISVGGGGGSKSKSGERERVAQDRWVTSRISSVHHSRAIRSAKQNHARLR